MSTYVELRRSRWMEKLAYMSNKHFLRLLLGAWINKARRNGKSGRSQQTIRHAYVSTLQKLGYTDKNMNINTWMSDARVRNIWSKRVESFYLYPKVRTQEKMQNIRQLNLEFFQTNNINIKAQAL